MGVLRMAVRLGVARRAWVSIQANQGCYIVEVESDKGNSVVGAGESLACSRRTGGVVCTTLLSVA